MIERLFVYGTLAPGRENEHWLAPLGGSWEPGTVRGTLHPQGWGAAAGYRGIDLDPDGAEIDGLLFTSDKLGSLWTRLDEFEGEGYARVATTVTLRDGRTVDAYIYVLNRGR